MFYLLGSSSVKLVGDTCKPRLFPRNMLYWMTEVKRLDLDVADIPRQKDPEVDELRRLLQKARGSCYCSCSLDIMNRMR